MDSSTTRLVCLGPLQTDRPKICFSVFEATAVGQMLIVNEKKTIEIVGVQLVALRESKAPDTISYGHIYPNQIS